MDVFPDLTDEERGRSTFALVPPMLCLGTAPDQCFFFLVRPTGPETIDVEIGYIFHPSALEDPLFEAKLALSDAGVQVFVEQDQDATTKCSGGSDHGLLREAPGIRGKRKVMCSSTGGWRAVIATPGREESPRIRACGSWGSESEEDSTVRMLIRPDQRVIRFRSATITTR